MTNSIGSKQFTALRVLEVGSPTLPEKRRLLQCRVSKVQCCDWLMDAKVWCFQAYQPIRCTWRTAGGAESLISRQKNIERRPDTLESILFDAEAHKLSGPALVGFIVSELGQGLFRKEA